MKEERNIFFGMVMLMGAAALIAERFGFLQGIGFWPILLNICLLSVLLNGIFRKKVGTVLGAAMILIFVNDELLHLETILKGISFWSILFSVFLLFFLVKGILWRQIGTILFSAAFLIIVNDELLHLESITPWPVLGAALLGTVGLNSLFPGWRHKNRNYPAGWGHKNKNYPVGIEVGKHDDMDEEDWEEYPEKGESDICDQDGEVVSYDVIFSQSTKYISGVVSRVDIDNIFGSIQVYFTEAQLERGRARVDVDCVFGSVVLYVPMSWSVELDTENIFGHSGRRGSCSNAGVNVLRVEGDIIFGKLEVIQI